MNGIDTVRDALLRHNKQVKVNGTGLMAQCPAHDDHTPSLSISHGNDQPVVLNCHAGCATSDVLTALDLNWSDISNPFNTPAPTPPATYIYTDADGTPLFRVVRGDNKRFRQQHLTVDGEWINGRGDIEPVLYNLTAVNEAITNGDPIYVVEGEKDADTLTRHGHTATTNPGGAGNFTAAMADALRDASQVIVIGDDDTPGHQHLEHIGELLTQRDIPHTLHLPKVGKDISEQEGQGFDPTRVRNYLPDADTTESDLGLELIDWTTINDRPEALIDGLIFPGRWIAFFGKAKCGKSTALLAFSLDIIRGHDTITEESRTPTPVLYIDAEMGRIDLHERLNEHGIANPADLTNWYATDLPKAFDSNEGAEHLLHTVEQLNIGCVIIDGINGAVNGNENDDTTWRDFYKLAIRPLKSRGVAIITGDNTGKDVSLGQRGSSVKQDKPDATALVSQTNDGTKISVKLRRTPAYKPETILRIHNVGTTEPITFTSTKTADPAGTSDCIAELDALGLSDTATNAVCQQALRTNKKKFRNDVIAAAIRRRKTRDPFGTDTTETLR